MNSKLINIKGLRTGDDGDYTEIIKNAISELISNGGGVLHFPSGHYNLMEKIIIKFNSKTPISIRGEGPSGNSVLFWDCPDGGFYFEITPEDNPKTQKKALIIEDLVLLSKRENSGTAIEIVTESQDKIHKYYPKINIFNLIIGGYNFKPEWKYGIKAKNCFSLSISTRTIISYVGTAIKIEGDNVLRNIKITHVYIHNAGTGIDILSKCNKIFIRGVKFSDVTNGILWITQDDKAKLNISGNFFDT